jgi:hypothetical protein
MPSPKPETIFDIDQLFSQLNESFVSAAAQLRKTFDEKPEWKDSPFVYHMPKMHISMKLELSYSNGKVKGLFGLGGSESASSQVVSTIDVDVVAVPRSFPERSTG